MTTWVLVANNSRARLFSTDKARSSLQEQESFVHPESRAKTHDLVSDQHGRTSDNQRTMDPNIAPKQHEALTFAKELSDRLRDGRVQGQFDKLYIAAGPTFLGMLRGKLDAQTAQLVVAEIDKDLTQLAAEEIRQHLPWRL